MNLRTLLVPFDGSKPSLAALDTSLQIASSKGARLSGLFVMDTQVIEGHFLEDLAGSMGVAPFLGLEQQSRKAFKKIGEALMDAFQKRCEDKHVPCQVSVVEDSVSSAIATAGRKADLVVMGLRGRRGTSGPIGSNVERAVRVCPAPLLIVPQEIKSVRHVLAGYDGSTHGRTTLDLAAAACAWFGAELTVLHVSADKEGQEVLSGARKLASKRRTETKFLLEKGDPASALARIAHGRKYDLMVLGAFGQGYLREFLLGSTTDLVLRETRTPLLIHR